MCENWTSCLPCNEPLDNGLDGKHTNSNKGSVSDDTVLAHDWQDDSTRILVQVYIFLLYSTPFYTVSIVEYWTLYSLDSCSFPYLAECLDPDRNCATKTIFFGGVNFTPYIVYLCFKYLYVKYHFGTLV